jgi:two-component system, cell cycle sensor histidine kinase and response regulator CckA
VDMTKLNVIIVEDNENDLLLILIALKKAGYTPNYSHVQTRSELEAALQDEQWQLVISDHAMPGFSAPEALEVLKESGRNLPFIIVSGTIEEELATKLIKGGAEDYINKRNLTQLPPAVEHVLAR